MKRFFLLILFSLFVIQSFFCSAALAKTVSSNTAKHIVKGLLSGQSRPMETLFGSEIDNATTFTDSNMMPLYHIISLKPCGFVIVSGDDCVEPIICFSSAGTYDLSEQNPLGDLVSRDIPARVTLTRTVEAKVLSGISMEKLTKLEIEVRKSGPKAFDKWKEMLSVGSGILPAPGKSSVSDVRVPPLLKTKWGQYSVCQQACFNYYTPPYDQGNTLNYPAGCVAVAMAQYMRFWQYPVSGVGTQYFTIYIDGYQHSAHLLGGDGSGGAYNWSRMPYVPDCVATETQRKAIGALVYDAGLAVGMDYSSLDNGGSGASMFDMTAAMVDTFGYDNAILGYSPSSIGGTALQNMVNTNLDSGNPVILAVGGYEGGHAVVADGYGYQGSTMYYHLNMGWDGLYDVWYNLPNIDTDYYSFNTVDAVVYNIFKSGTGEIISGRVTTVDSKPIPGAIVTAVIDGGGETYHAATNTKGIYAFVKVPSDSIYTLTAVSEGHMFYPQVTNTGLSSDGESISGNCWARNFTSLRDFTISKCTVRALTDYDDYISVSGKISASEYTVSSADEIVVDINSADMDSHFVCAFPSNSTTLRNGRFKCTLSGIPLSFALNTETLKFTFRARDVDLSGLSCPFEIKVEIGGFDVETVLDETTVNGRRPIPIKLLMGVKNSLRVDKTKFTRNGQTGNISKAVVSGGFSVKEIDDANLAVNDVNITVGSQVLTIPAGSLRFYKGKYICSKVLLPNGEIAWAVFDFNRCTFKLTIKNTSFSAPAGTADFSIDFADFNEVEKVLLP